MHFYTYDYGSPGIYNWPYLITKISKYLKIRDFTPYETILIDPGVFDLIDSPCYKWEKKIDINDFLETLSSNHFFSFDYPCDMNEKYTKLFLRKSWENAQRFSSHSQYIVTVQYRYNDYWSFQEWFDKYNELDIASNFMGLGNICKQRGINEFLKHAIPYAFKNSKAKWIHVYGANKHLIHYLKKLEKKYNKKVTVDNRKWEFYAPSSKRPEYFQKYIEDLNL